MKFDPSAAKAIASKTLNLDVRLVGNLIHGKSTSRKTQTMLLFSFKRVSTVSLSIKMAREHEW